MIFEPRLRARQPRLEVEILLDAVAVGPHLPHGLGAENVAENGGVDGAGGHGGPFRKRVTLHSKRLRRHRAEKDGDEIAPAWITPA